MKDEYLEFRRSYYRPVVLIDYEREAFMLPFNNIRVTFDKDLRKSTTDLNMFTCRTTTPVFHDPVVILEVKFDRELPTWLGKLFNTLPHTRSAVSKYCLSRMEW